MEHTQTMQIGELAQALELNPKTVRYYEQIGLLPQPQRSESGYRLYTHHAIEHLRFILKAKAIGFTLEEICEIVLLQRNGEQPCSHVETLIEEKVAAIDAQLSGGMSVAQLARYVRTRYGETDKISRGGAWSSGLGDYAAANSPINVGYQRSRGAPPPLRY